MKEAIKNILKVLAVIAVLAVLVFIAYVADKNMSAYTAALRQKNKIEAVQGCITATSYAYTTKDGAKATEPVRSIYKGCLEDKGYESTFVTE
jgi:hypothetical protein